MTYEIYRYIFFGGAVMTLLMLIVSIIVFVVLKIPTVIGDLSGANARKAIEQIRNQNESSGDKLFRTSQINRERGRITDKISSSGRLISNPSNRLHGAMATEKIGTQKLEPSESNETTVLQNELDAPLCETTLLSYESETTLLSEDPSDAASVDISFVEAIFTEPAVEYEITFIHTDEVVA